MTEVLERTPERKRFKSQGTVKLSLHLSLETNDRLEQMCADNNLTKSDLLRKALALVEVALQNKSKGNHLVIMDNEDRKLGEIINL